MRISGGLGIGWCIVWAALAFCAKEEPPKGVEPVLRKRVARFYELMIRQKYREGEKMVAPGSRERYYAEEKPTLEDFKITGVTWQDEFKKAEVALVSTVKLRRAVIGEFEVKLPSASHWIYEKGKWWWYIPTVYERSTPFGKMKVDANRAKQSGMNLPAMIATGPKPQDLMHGVKASTARLSIVAGSGNTGTATLENTLPGVVRLSVKSTPDAGYSAELSRYVLGVGDRATLTVRRTNETAKSSLLFVYVEPTGQLIEIAVTQ